MARLLLIAVAVLSLAFAPAPLPRRDRESAQAKQRREVAALDRRLKELGTTWRVERGQGGRPELRADIKARDGGGASGRWPIADGDLPGALRKAVRDVEEYLRWRNQR